MKIEILRDIGLTDSEINVYLALLELGSSATGKIVEKSKVASSKIYEILDKLIQKGLVSFIVQSGVKHFEAAPPSRIMDYMQEKEEAFTKQKKELQNILPELELKQTLSKYKTEATIFRGVKGATTAFKQLIAKMNPGDEWIGYVIFITNKSYFNTLSTLHKERAKKGIKSRQIFNESARTYAQDRSTIPLTKIKYVSNDMQTPAIINVGGNITLINVNDNDPTIFLIESKEVADSFRTQFEKLWNQDVSTYEGIDNVTSFFKNILNDLKKGEEYYVINGNYGENEELATFFETYHKQRQQKGIKANLLFNSNLHDTAARLALPPAECKFLSPDFKSPLQVTFYGEKLFMSLWKQNPIGFLIKRKEIVDAFKAYFDSLWSQDTVISKGFEALKTEIEGLLSSYTSDESYDVLGAAYGQGTSIPKYVEFFKNIHEKRVQLGISTRLLFQQGVESIVQSRPEYQKLILTQGEYKFLPYKTDFPVGIYLSRKKTVLLIYDAEPLIITINNPVIAQSFKLHFESMWRQDTKISKGFDALHVELRQLLRTEKEYQLLGGAYGTDASVEEYVAFFTKFHQERIAQHVPARMLFQQGTEHIILTHSDYKKKLSIEGAFKFMPYKTDFPVAIIPSKDKTLLIIYEKEPTIITISNPVVAKSFVNHFESMWNQKVQTYEGEQAVLSAYNDLIEHAKLRDEIVVFAAKPSSDTLANAMFEWNKNMRKKVKRSRLLYYGNTTTNRERAAQIASVGCETKIYPTQEILPISTVVCGDIALYSLWQDVPITFRIENKTLADSLRTNFEILWNQEVKIFRGYEGAHQAWDNMLEELKPGEEYLVLGASKNAWLDRAPALDDYLRNFHHRRIQKKVKARFMFISGMEEAINQHKDLYMKLGEVKFLPQGIYEGIQINLYKNKVLMLVWREKEPIIFLIEDQVVYDTFLTYYNNLWNQETRVVKGLDAIQTIFDEIVESGHCDFIGARGYFVGRSSKKYIDEWEKRAIKNRFTMRNIVDPGVKGHKITLFPFAQTKYTLPEAFSKLSVFWIYKEKVVISNWTQDEPIAIIIENKSLHDMYEQQFEILWNSDITLKPHT